MQAVIALKLSNPLVLLLFIHSVTFYGNLVPIRALRLRHFYVVWPCRQVRGQSEGGVGLPLTHLAQLLYLPEQFNLLYAE